MKALFFSFAFLASVLAVNQSNAQVGVTINIGRQPVWGPVGYDYVDYYYLPDLEAYYYVPQRQFIYLDGGKWVRRASLPPRYSTFDLYGAHKVVINERDPYLHHDVYKVKYVTFKGKHDQQIIRESHDERYFVIQNHPEHGKWKGQEGNVSNHGEHRSAAPMKGGGSRPQGGGGHEQHGGQGHGESKGGGGHHKK